jgi:hypothetical protein
MSLHRSAVPLLSLVSLLAACGGAVTFGPSAADKPGGATNMQPGSGGSINDVVRSEGNDQPVRPDATPQSATDPTPAPARDPIPPPTPSPPPPPPR